ncbi:hypothetical protein ACFLZN_01450, partial [Nanoarchaeota archaeon]
VQIESAPQMINQFTDVSRSDAIITAVTNYPTNLTIRWYGLNNTCQGSYTRYYGYQNDRFTYDDYQIVNRKKISNLNANTTYYFKLKNCGDNGLCSTSKCLRTTTLAPGQVPNSSLYITFTGTGNASDPVGNLNIDVRFEGGSFIDRTSQIINNTFNFNETNRYNVDLVWKNNQSIDWAIECTNANILSRVFLNLTNVINISNSTGDYSIGLNHLTFRKMYEKLHCERVKVVIPSAGASIQHCNSQLQNCTDVTDIGRISYTRSNGSQTVFRIPPNLGFSVYAISGHNFTFDDAPANTYITDTNGNNITESTNETTIQFRQTSTGRRIVEFTITGSVDFDCDNDDDNNDVGDYDIYAGGNILIPGNNMNFVSGHTENNISVEGNNVIATENVTYVDSASITGGGRTAVTTQQISSQSMPSLPQSLAVYKTAAQAAGTYYAESITLTESGDDISINGGATIPDNSLIYVENGSIIIAESNFERNVTLISTGGYGINVTGNHVHVISVNDSLLAYADADIYVEGNTFHTDGTIMTTGDLYFNGESGAVSEGSIIAGGTILVDGNNFDLLGAPDVDEDACEEEEGDDEDDDNTDSRIYYNDVTTAVHQLSNEVNINPEFDLFVVNDNNNQGVFVCPNVTSLSQLYLPDCGGTGSPVTFYTSDIGTTKSGITVTLDGNDYRISNVTGTGAGQVNNTNLTIYDEFEESSTTIYNSIDFYANYTNSTGTRIPNANCTIEFDDGTGPFNMTDNGANYNYTKTSGFSTKGIHDWNVTCSHTNFSTVSVNDTINITGFGANLTLYDEYENSSVAMYSPIDFFANYTNTSGTHISNASCNITFDDGTGPFAMTDNSANYNYTKSAGFNTSAVHEWNVTCNHANYTELSGNNSVSVSYPEAIPEFSEWALILATIITIAGFITIRHKRQS